MAEFIRYLIIIDKYKKNRKSKKTTKKATDHLTDELDGAEEYVRMGLKVMAQDECRHALYFIKKAQTKGQDVVEHVARLNALQAAIKALPDDPV